MEIDAIKKKVLEDVDPRIKEIKRKEERKTRLITTVQFLALIIIMLVVFYILMGISTVDGDSMYPTLHDQDKVVYMRSVPEYKVGDIVVVNRPGGEEYVKRIVAVAGDTVNIQAGKLYVNGKEAEFEEALGETDWMSADIQFPVQVGASEVFVVGDNREISEDSRSFGPVSMNDIAGRILYYIGKI